MGKSGQNTGAITGVGLKPIATSMVHVAVNFFSVQHDLMAGLTTDVSHEAYTAGIMFERRVVQPLFPRRDAGQGQPTVLSVGHRESMLFANAVPNPGRM